MNVVVTGGGTIAPIDDVRVIANVSSGRLSAALSEACLRQGANVWHIHAPTAQLPLLRHARFDLDTREPDAEHARLDRLRDDWLRNRERLHLRPLRRGDVAEYAESLKTELTSRPIDVVFLAMAVSDFQPDPVSGKIDSDADSLVIRAHRAPKVIRSVRDWSPGVFLVGFKLLSGVPVNELVRAAETACQVNRADVTIANDLETVQAGRHTVHLVRPGHVAETISPGVDLADRVVSRIFAMRQEAR